MTTTGSKPILAIDGDGREVRYQTDGGPLGVGSGGTVYLARKLPSEDDAGADESRRVAIKLSHAPKWKDHLAEEARLLYALQARTEEVTATGGAGIYRPVRILSGPKPLKVTDTYDSELIELEYLDGSTLRNWIDETWTKSTELCPTEVVDEVLRIARQLGESLLQIQLGQEGPLIHRDIKPDNVMRTSRGLRLFDFNVAREDGFSTKTEHVGTPGYMAPEVMAGGSYDGRADLYSVGVILWEVAHRKRFDLNTHTIRVEGKVQLRWPSAAIAEWPESEQQVLKKLLPALVVDLAHRLESAAALLELVDQLEVARRVSREVADPLTSLDMVSLLSELRPSGIASVVTDTGGRMPDQGLQDFLRARMQVDDPLEDWLLDRIVEATTSDCSAPSLFVLAGNAGDGKSHLLFRLMRSRLAKRPELLSRLRVIADATQALHAYSSQRDRLAEFFSPFADSSPVQDRRVHVIAMNTGMIIRFFEGEEDRRQFAGLYAQLQLQLGLRRNVDDHALPPWRVEVVNLDLRNLLASGSDDHPSFAERMLDRLSTSAEGAIPAAKWADCERCPAFALCPVAFNLRALELPSPRKALLSTLRRVALEGDVHLSPRNMWGFLYRLVTGGVERYDVSEPRQNDGPCDVIRARVSTGDGEWLLAGQFTELMFGQAGAGTPWTGMARHDPAFSSAPAIDHLHTRLSIKTELDNAEDVVEELGGSGQSLAGLALDALTAMLPRVSSFRGRRRDAAVRRQVFFHPKTFESWLVHDGSVEFGILLQAYQAYSTKLEPAGELTRAHQDQLIQLKELVREVFLHGNGRVVRGTAYLRVSQPNARARTELLVRADVLSLDPIFNIKQLVAPDMHIVAHFGRPLLLKLLGYSPTQVTLDVLGVRLTVDLSLYDFLRRVTDGQKPSVRDLSQFQALLFIGERVGNELARRQGARELFLWDGNADTLLRLGTNDFGQAHLKQA